MDAIKVDEAIQAIHLIFEKKYLQYLNHGNITVNEKALLESVEYEIISSIKNLTK